MPNPNDAIQAKNQRKLHSALIEIGKEVEKMKDAPDLTTLQEAFENFRIALEINCMKGKRLYGRLLAAVVTKWMIDKL